MLIVQISDTHITTKGDKAYGIAPVEENLQRCVDHINQLDPKPDLVLVTGDISYSGKPVELENAKRLLSNLKAPYFVIPGNHDNRLNLLASFSKTNLPIKNNKQQFINYVIDDYDIRLIAMDSTVAGQPGGKICDIRASWLDKQLAKSPDKPTLIFLHHPPLKLSVLETDQDGFEGADKLANVIQKYSNIKRLICGHVHLATFSQWQNTIVSTSPATCMALRLDLSMTLPSQFSLQDPGYQLHHWTTDKTLITHTVTVPAKQRFYLFEKQ